MWQKHFVNLLMNGKIKMSEGYQFKIDKSIIEYCKNHTSYEIEITNDGKIY